MYSWSTKWTAKMVRGRIKWELTESAEEVCTVQVFGQKPLYSGNWCSLRSTYHGRGIPCPRMAQDGTDDMHMWVWSLLQRYRLQNRRLFLLDTHTGSSGIPQYSRQLLHSKPWSMHNGLLGGNNSQRRDNVIDSNCFKMSWRRPPIIYLNRLIMGG